MRSKRGCFFSLFGILSLCGLVGLASLGIWFLFQRQEQARATYAPPVVMVNEPAPGASVPVGSYFPLTATIFNTPDAPLQRVEIWLNGELQEKREFSSAESALSPLFYTHLLMPAEGAYVLTVRAVNQEGIVGQSEPVIVTGVSKPQDIRLLVPLPEGGNLASLAAAYGTDEATLQALNPGLGGQPPAPGAIIAVPKPAGDDPPADQPPAPPGNFAVIPPDLLPLQPVTASPGLNLSLTQVRPPEAPSDMQAQAADCQIKLVWNDNADDESGYNLWMSSANLPAHIIATLQPSVGGQTWFEFPAPAGGHINFWVEATNLIGGQPSNIVSLEIDSACFPASTTSLQVALLDMSVTANYDRAYCYVSLEDAPEVRLPEGDGNFIAIQEGQGNVAAWPHVFSVPIPADRMLEVSGECWGWAGGALSKLGSFSDQSPIETWDGSRRVLEGGAFQIGMAVSPMGATNQSGVQTYDYFPDPLLPPPYNVQEAGTRCPGFTCAGTVLTWKWEPSPNFKKPITGFEIYLDGKSYKTVNDPNARSSPVTAPAGCGKRVRWQVAAVAGIVRSMLSLPFEYDLPPCYGYAVVKFETLEIPWTGDGISDGPCDELELYYELALASDGYSGQRKQFGWGGEEKEINPVFIGFFPTAGLFELGTGSIMELLSIRCTKDAPPYTFAKLGSSFGVPNPDTLIVVIPQTKISLWVGTFFWDQDDSSHNDAFGFRWLEHKFPDLQAAQNELGCGKTFRDPPQDYRQEDDADTAVSYTLTVYPNACAAVPQGIPLPTLPKK